MLKSDVKAIAYTIVSAGLSTLLSRGFAIIATSVGLAIIAIAHLDEVRVKSHFRDRILDFTGRPIRIAKSPKPWLDKAILTAMLVVLVSGGLWKFSRPKLNNQKPTELPKPTDNRHNPASFKQLFDTGDPNLTSYYNIATLIPITGTDKSEVKVPWKLNGDFSSRSRFLEFFLDDNVFPDSAFAVCVSISKNYQQLIDTADSSVDIAGRLPEDSSATHFKDMTFSGRIFIYYRNPGLSLQQKSYLESLYKQHGLSLQFRGEEYALLHRTEHPPLMATAPVPNGVLLPDPEKSGVMLTVTNLSRKK